MSDSVEVIVQIPQEEESPLAGELCLLDPGARGERLLEYAQLGHLMASLAQVSLSKDGLRGYFSELTGAMDSLTDVVTSHRSLFQAASGSSQTGVEGEAYVLTQLTRTFRKTGDTFDNWSTSGHQGDIRAMVEGDPARSVLIEVKNQGAPIKHQEVQRFQRDMIEHPHFVGGVFVSLRSRIPGASSIIDVTVVDGRPLVYVHQRSAGDKHFVIAWGVLRYWLSSGQGASPNDLATALSRISARRLRAEVSEFEQGSKEDMGRIRAIRDSAAKIEQQAASLRREADGLEARIGAKAGQLARFLLSEAEALDSGTLASPSGLDISLPAWLEHLGETGVDTDRHAANLERLYHLISMYSDVELYPHEDGFSVLRGDEPCMEVTGGKTYVEIDLNEDLLDPITVEAFDWHEQTGRLRYRARKTANLHEAPISRVLNAATE